MLASIVLSTAVFMGGDFVPYVNSFIKDSQGVVRYEDLDGAEIVFKDLEYSEKGTGVIGYCYSHIPFVTKGFRIEIDPVFWNSQTELDRWQLMYHELGHCLCGLDHTPIPSGEAFIAMLERIGIRTSRDQYLPGHCQKSLMHPYTLETVCVRRYKDYYVQELFGKCQPVLPNSFWIEKTR